MFRGLVSADDEDLDVRRWFAIVAGAGHDATLVSSVEGRPARTSVPGLDGRVSGVRATIVECTVARNDDRAPDHAQGSGDS